MKHTPLGYDIVNGKAVINEEEAERIKIIYAGYLLGLTMKASAKMAGLDITHSRVKNIMQNKRYLGDEYYPQLIDEETFHAAEAERKRREKALGRENRKKDIYTPAVFTKFKMLKAEEKYKDPVKQAEYIYSRIKEVGV